ncbi:MAG: MFS transporter [Propionicimonas sp.]|uniref:MFS transporter n=1 Tax=Propionicimonas sp. TaxID=1955623 RepID=UPI002B20C94E|nr:MFS transporter [Propionicimonas sp.]MEA4943434.1 MFS transporter [Propionicimonas sp.]MEA5053765.1 MFS transporter [Propionicimonas sp.]MEA5119473.1 MFS transporter [Propionicimonas sp.]
MIPLNAAAARRIFLLLTVTRWFPVGLVVPVTTLLYLERGLDVAHALTLASVVGLVVFALELPTAGIADTLGRRPVLLAGAVLQVLAAVLYCTADSFWAFTAAAVAMGVFRALDSGPLESWFVDTVHRERPGADVDRTLAQQGAVLGVSIALGSLACGGLVWWHPVQFWSALTLPYVAYAVLAAVHLTMLAMLLREPARHADGRVRAALATVRQVPGTVATGLRLARDNGVLRALLLVEVFWSTAMVVFESFTPIRLGELLADNTRAGALMGPVASVGWAVFALGSGLAGLASARIGVARTALLARVLNGLGAVWMGLAGGPAALVVAYLATYGLHGSGGPVYNTLLHREAVASNRTTVLSMASMLGFLAYAIASPLLGWTAATVSTPVAMVAGGGFSVLGALCFVPALRRERQRASAPVGADGRTPA